MLGQSTFKSSASTPKTLVLAGVATDIGIEFTARHAAALGYYCVIAEDATGSYQPQPHARSIEFLRSSTMPVITAADICAHWTTSA